MLPFIRKYPALLAFGILTAAFSSPGQSFLVSFFFPHLQEALRIGAVEISTLYGAATFVSALLLPWIGRLLDRLDLLSFTVVSGLLLAAGCFLLSRCWESIGLFAGFLLIRNLGQGAMTMISMTTMAKIFERMRGTALGISNLGFPVGEAFFPIAVSTWILTFGWRSGWMFLAGLVLFFFIPAVFLLLFRDPHKRAQEEIAKQIESAPAAPQPLRAADHDGRDWSVGEMLRDPRFYLLLFPLLVPPALFTALFLHHAYFIEWRGWTMHQAAAGFMAFALARAAISFLIGPLIDRYSARTLYPAALIPLAAGLVCFLTGPSSVFIFLYLGFCGMTMGLAMTISPALYAELYGTKELGAIRGVTSSVITYATAVAPIVMGFFVKNAVSPSGIVAGMIGAAGLGSVLAWTACQR